MNEFFRESAGREWKSRYGGDEMSVTLGGKKKFAVFRLLACSLSGLWWLGLPPSVSAEREGRRKEGRKREGGREDGERSREEAARYATMKRRRKSPLGGGGG